MGDSEDILEKENARVGYQVAVSIMLHEEQAIWSRSSAMLAANGIIIATMGVVLTKLITLVDSDSLKGNTGLLVVAGLFAIVIVLGLVGWLLCNLWHCLIGRTRKKCRCWEQSARKLEKLMRPTVKTLKYGRRLSMKGQVKIGWNTEIVMCEREKNIEIKGIADSIACIFKCIYAVLAVVGLVYLVSNLYCIFS